MFQSGRKILGLFSGLLVLSSCAGLSSGGSSIGLYTYNIEADFSWPDQEVKNPEVLVLVLGEKRSFVQPDTFISSVHTDSFALVFTNHGQQFSLDTELDWMSAQLYFFHSGSLTESIAFSQSLGRGNLKRQVLFKKDPRWEFNFLLYIKPFLTRTALEPAYRLTPTATSQIGSFLEKEERKLPAQNPLSKPPP